MNSVMDSVTTDDGIGFDPEKKSDGFGIRSMQERENALGRAVNLESDPGKGTHISDTVALEILEQDEGEVIPH
jgi:signal transduction histidine kinase